MLGHFRPRFIVGIVGGQHAGQAQALIRIGAVVPQARPHGVYYFGAVRRHLLADDEKIIGFCLKQVGEKVINLLFVNRQ